MGKHYFIGIGSSLHDPAISILDEEGSVLFAESTERYLQNKRAIGCPADPYLWIEQLLDEHCTGDAEFHLATTWSAAHVKRLQLLGLLGFPGRGNSGLLNSERFVKSVVPAAERNWNLRLHSASNGQAGASIEKYLYLRGKGGKIHWHSFNHHLAHAAMACYGSGFDEALCLVADGAGEQGTISTYVFTGNQLTPLTVQKGFESPGAFYTRLTELCGFDPNKGEEWKVMGLAAYGKKDVALYSIFHSFFEVAGCTLKVKSSFSAIRRGLALIGKSVEASGNAFQARADLACTGQFVFAEWMTQIISNLYAKGKSQHLVFAGGCALNSSFNGTITRNTGFKKLYVPSAPADDGASLGAAYLAYQKALSVPAQSVRTQQSPYLGSFISDEEAERYIRYSGVKNYQRLDAGFVCRIAAEKLAQGKIIGWIQGRAEFGPRALGNRSILADPRSAAMKQRLNDEVKFREEFRPFAPAILPEFGSQYFESYEESPYMDRTLKFRDAVMQQVPAIVHEDGTGRLQSVNKAWNPRFYDLIQSFYEITGIPLVLNTSFNVMGKPMVHGFNDALQVFQNSGMDALVVNEFLFEKG